MQRTSGEAQEEPGRPEPDAIDLGWWGVGFGVVTLLLMFEPQDGRPPRKSRSCGGRGQPEADLGCWKVFAYIEQSRSQERRTLVAQTPRGSSL